MARLYGFYKDKVTKDLMKQFGYTSVMQVPRIEKITLNMGVGEAVADKKVMEFAVGDMQKIAGQKPVVTMSKKSIAGFKIREGYPVGCKVTLRKERMYEFLDRLISVAIPRIRDFRGISGKSFDGRGNYNMGVKEQIIFPEIEYEKIDALRGMNITITTSAKTDEEAKALLLAFKLISFLLPAGLDDTGNLTAHREFTQLDTPQTKLFESAARTTGQRTTITQTHRT